MHPELPFEGCYVVDTQLMAGPYPTGRTTAMANYKLQALLDAGIDAVIYLTREHEAPFWGHAAEGYAARLQALAEERNRRLRYHRFGFLDMSVPDPELMMKILDTIDALRSDGAHVYVHCYGGVGRTGTVVGCWIARHGIANGPAVLATIDRLRGFEASRHLHSPQTDAQRMMVTGWERGR